MRPESPDPLTEVVSLLQPTAPFTKLSSAAGSWCVSRAQATTPFYCAILEGACRLEIQDQDPLHLQQDDFVVIPANCDFIASSLVPPAADEGGTQTVRDDGEIRHGDPLAPADVRMLIGYCDFASPDASLLSSLLPQYVRLREVPRLTTLMTLLQEESRHLRPARAVVLVKLTEVLLIEAFRAMPATTSPPGLIRGLADQRIACALRQIHADPAKAWTVLQLAKVAAMSRSSFFQRFNQTVGMPPMKYLLIWRMALAKQMLRQQEHSLPHIAERVGYSIAGTFSMAFSRHNGQPPGQYAKTARSPSAKPAA